MLITLTLVFLSAFGLSLALTPGARVLARKTNVVARTKRDRWHHGTVPLLGGVAIFASFALIAGAVGGWALAPLIACSAAVFALGLVDDVRRLSAATKLVVQVTIAATLIYIAPIWQLTGWVVVDYLLALLWLVGITNAFNLLDNVDGLAAGVALLAAACYVPALWGAAPELLIAIAAFAGSAAGFLLYNFQPASIFMGDSGSQFLGFFLASISLLVAPGLQSRVLPITAVPVLILLVPIFDTTFVALTRRMAGRSPLTGGRDHTSHRLVALGIGERRAVILLYLLTAAGGSIAASLQYIDSSHGFIAIVAYILLLAGLGVLLGHVKVAEGETRPAAAAQPLIGEITARNRVIEVLIDLALIGLAYYAAFAFRFQGDEFSHFLPYFAASFPAVLGIQLAGLWLAGKYRQVWRRFGASELVNIVKGVAIGVAASVILVLYLYRFVGFSRAVFVIQPALLTVLLIGSRVAITRLDEYLLGRRRTGELTLLYGAGRRGLMLARELLEDLSLALQPIGFVDDDRAKQGLHVEGLPVLGTGDQLPALLAQYQPDQVLVTPVSFPPEKLAEIERACRRAGVGVRRLRFELEELGVENTVDRLRDTVHGR